MLEVDRATVLRRLHEMGKIQKFGKWVPQTALPVVSTYAFIACWIMQEFFVENCYDKKWIMYDNPKHIHLWIDFG